MTDAPRITPDLVRGLIAAQFPQWTSCDIRPVGTMGWDNRTFHLGERMLVRLPSAARYAAQPQKEWACLPILASALPVPIPSVLGKGNPTDAYPFEWTVLAYLPGVPVTHDDGENASLAKDVGACLNALRAAPTDGGPAPGQHNFHRGGDLRIYDQELRHTLMQLGTQVDSEAMLAAWQRACHSAWTSPPVWLHGDVAMGNLLIEDGRLAGVIDFGSCAVGDPACDLTIAWTLFTGDARRAFVDEVSLDKQTWNRARGWALWKAALQLAQGDQRAAEVIRAVLSEA